MAQNIIIVSGGRLGDAAFFRESLDQLADKMLIACDSGARHLATVNLEPDVLIGDMDSVSEEILANYKRRGVTIVRHPADKDFTDTALALDYALDSDPSRIDIWGAQGGRIDHALANIFLLIRGREKGVPIRLMDDYSEMFVSQPRSVFDHAEGCLVSLIALSPEVRGVTLLGFCYPLEDEALSMSASRGISNIIMADHAEIHIRFGDLLVIRYWKKDVMPEVL